MIGTIGTIIIFSMWISGVVVIVKYCLDLIQDLRYEFRNWKRLKRDKDEII